MAKTRKPTPVSRAAKTESTSPILGSDGRQKRLTELVQIVIDTATAKGWSANISSRDDATFKYASVLVRRPITPGSAVAATGVLDLTCTDIIKLSQRPSGGIEWGVQDLLNDAWAEIEKLSWIKKSAPGSPNLVPPKDDQFQLVERILRRFRPYARQLQQRYGDRAGIVIEDEYDLQDTVHALLRALFDDVRPEEYAPSYAGGNSRIDFLLKSEEIAVELKLARKTLRDKQIGEELLIDIARYQSHPDCKTLICFVYDPDGFVKNPSGLENDLSKTHDKIKVRVILYSN
jgi:hypothetical protein